jgi:glycosyltransferase involved in cell wall biosynthesis
MKKYIFFTNIPSPYRISFYNELFKYGFNFEVYYMRNTEADRNWKVDPRGLKHPFYIDQGFYKMIGRYHLHFNPRLILKLLKAKGAEIIVGASWNDIDLLILIVLKKLGILKNQLHFWSEANYLTIGASNDNIIKRFLRKFVYNSSNGAQISSGKMTEITFEKWGMKGKTFINLPNTIEEEKFQITEEEIDKRDQNTLPVFLMPVRLKEKIKGIINFFNSIGIENIRKGLFLIAGDGPDKEAIQRFIKSYGVDENIKLLGFCDTEEMVSLYKRANVLVLPSFSDPSPLTLVEGLIMKLPLLVSERCGNHFEAVLEGHNGYLFNPFDPTSVKLGFESLMHRVKEWRNMGFISGGRYHEIFYRQLVIKNFIRELTEFCHVPPAKPGACFVNSLKR